MIRLASTADGAACAGIYGAVVETSAATFEVTPPSPSEMGARIASALQVAPWLVDERDGQIVGYAYGSRHRERAAYQWSVDVGVYVGDGQRRGGVGRSLYTSLLALLRLQGFFVAHAGITLPNEGSVGLHESLGFAPVGVYRDVGFKMGAWRDVGWWRLPLQPRVMDPPPPRTLEDAARDPAWPLALRLGDEGGSLAASLASRAVSRT